MFLKDSQFPGRSARRFCLFLFLITALLVPPNRTVLYAAAVPSGFTDSMVANGLSGPTAMELRRTADSLFANREAHCASSKTELYWRPLS